MELRVEKTAGLYVSDRGLRALADLVHDYSGICIGPDKHQLMANRLRRRVQDVGLLSLDDYGDFVRADATGEEIETLVDLMTTNHTAFFRESEHFTVLMQELAPTLRAAMPTGYPVRVWSAAASSGEEPYTPRDADRRRSASRSSASLGAASVGYLAAYARRGCPRCLFDG